MRVPTAPGRSRSRFRVRGWLIALVIAVLVLLFSLRGLAGFYTDYLWFDSVGQTDTWRGLLGARIVPALVFTVVFFAIMFANLFIADRLAPKYRSMGPEDELVERYQHAVAPYTGRIRIGVSLFFALVAGVGVSSQWHQWVLFTNRVDFGIEDPQFHRDIGFYVFQLPFLRFIADWLFAGLVIVLLVTAVAHYLNGGIRFQSPFQRVTPQVKAHLSVILAIMALVKTAQYYLAQFELNFSDRGVGRGASYTDVRAQLPALRLLMFISVAAAALFIWNIWRRGWIFPIIAVGLWGFVSIVIGTIYPAGVQRFSVNPNEFESEQPYIDRNIEATRAAFGLDTVDQVEFDYQPTLTEEVVADNRATIDNARLWDPDVSQSTFQTLQGLTTFYQFDDVDIDRYPVNGDMRQVVLSAREINSNELPSQSWVNQHLVYTHGYGVVAAPTNEATTDGDPDFILEDIPLPENAPIEVTQPEIYFGENLAGYALVDAKQREFNYPREGRADATNRYGGDDGVTLSNLVRRGAFALRFGDINPLISGQVTGTTKVLYNRDIRERVDSLAPFLDFDADPYPVVVDGRVLWMLDGYTTTNEYPYSESYSGSGGLDHDFSYVRNSVKATVDAYDGTITFYVIDPDDPLIRAYQKAFPDLFTDFDEMSDELRAHLRYPEDLFRVQSDVFATYHVTNDRRFYNGNAKWLLSPDPGSGTLDQANLAAAEPADADTDQDEGPQDAMSTGRRMDPYYLYITLPGEQAPSFIILQPFVPVSEGNQQTRLVSFMVANSDPDRYGEMLAYEMPQGETVRGPVQVNNEIASTAEISRVLSLLDQRGSTVISGSMQLIPVGESILYIRPIYVQGSGASGFPQYRFVVMFTPGQEAAMTTTIEEGLAVLFGELEQPDLVGEDGVDPAAEPDEEEPEEPDSTTTTTTTTPAQPEELPEDVQGLIDLAAERYAEAQAALEAGNLGRYQELIDEVGDLIEQAQEAAAGGGSGDGNAAPLTSRP
jgi:uncharacterized membrane protein (UPF0182 family)